MKRLWIVGCGGHASEVIENARAGGEFDVVGILDDDETRWGSEFFGVPVYGPISMNAVEKRAIRFAVIAIGSNAIRSKIANRLEGRVTWCTVIHPTAYIASGSEIAEGVMIGVNAVVQPGSRVGGHVIVNTAAVVGHDVEVGDFAHIGPGVILAGGASIGAGTFLGTGVSVIPNVTVGDWSTVGAGAAAVNDIPSNTIAVGVPARPVT